MLVLPVLKLLIGKILPVPAVRSSLIGIQMLITGVAMPLRLTIRASPMVHGARQRRTPSLLHAAEAFRALPDLLIDAL